MSNKGVYARALTQETAEDIDLMVTIIDETPDCTVQHIKDWTGWGKAHIDAIMAVAENIGLYFWHDPAEGPEIGILRRPDQRRAS
jgi:hypothetical protein